MSIDELYEGEHEGIEYCVDGNGNGSVPEGELSMDDEETYIWNFEV